jgi:hypothetical protein
MKYFRLPTLESLQTKGLVGELDKGTVFFTNGTDYCDEEFLGQVFSEETSRYSDSFKCIRHKSSYKFQISLSLLEETWEV